MALIFAGLMFHRLQVHWSRCLAPANFVVACELRIDFEHSSLLSMLDVTVPGFTLEPELIMIAGEQCCLAQLVQI